MIAIEKELADLKTRVEKLEAQLSISTQTQPKPAGPTKPGSEMTRDEIIAWLLDKGLIRLPTEEEKRLAAELEAEWQALSEEEKKAIQWELDHLPPGPMVSDIVIENRRSIWDSTTSTPAP